MAIALVQKAGFTNNTTATVPLAFGSNNTLGNLLVAMVGYASAKDFVSITDSQGNTWVQAGADNANANIFYAANCKAGANTVTVNKGGTTARAFLAIAEYSGVSATHALDQTSFVNGTTSAAPGDLVYCANAGELIVVMHQNGSAALNYSAPAAGWTIESSVTGQFAMWADNANCAQGGNVFSCTMSGSDAWHEKMAVFLPAVPAAPTAGINYVRSTESLNKTLSPSPGSPSSITFPGGNTAGNLILVVTNEFFPSSRQVTGITDTAGNAYTLLVSRFDALFSMVTSVWAVNGCLGINTANTVSAAFTSANVSDSVDIVAFEYSGQATSNLLDSAATAGTNSNVASSLTYNITPSAASEMLFSVAYRNSGPNTWSGFGIQVNPMPSKGNSNSETQVSHLLNATSGVKSITVTDSATQLGSFTIALNSQPSGPTTTGLKGQPVPIALCDLNGNVYAVSGTSKGVQVGGAIPVVITDPSGNVYTLTGTPTGVKMGNPTPIVLTDFNGNALAVNGSLSAFKAGRPYPVILCDQNGNAFSTSSYTGGAQQGAPLSAVLTDSNGNVQLSASLLATIVGMI